MAVDASEAAGVTDAAGVVRVSPVLVRLAKADVERHQREGTEAPLGIVKIAQARRSAGTPPPGASGHATARGVATAMLS